MLQISMRSHSRTFM